MTDYRQERSKYYMLLLSLLIHLGALIIILKLTKTDRFLLPNLTFQHTPEEQKNTPIPSFLLAQLKSRASHFGAPIIFHKEPELAPQEADDQAQQEHQTSNQETEHQTQAHEEPIKEQEQKQPETQEQRVLPEKAKALPKNTVSVAESQNIVKPPVKKPAQPPAVRKKLTPQAPSTQTRTAAPIKKQITLADLAEGFINTLNRGGKDWLDRDGDPNKRPDLEEMKYLSYTRKVIWYMQNEWRATQSKLKIDLLQNYILSVVITFLKDGSVGNIKVVNASGNQALDDFLIRGIRKASPYPKLPAHFNSDTFDLPLNIHSSHQPINPWQMSLSGPLGSKR
ncbi:MAG: TonB C-terminal domain-containing protein [Candidatus Babeliales bacterium]